MTLFACRRCATPIEKKPGGGRDPMWCSPQCRKAQYRGVCVDCGAPTNGSEGRGAQAPKHCRACADRRLNETKARRAWERRDRWIAMVRAGMMPWEIADAEGIPPERVARQLYLARQAGVDVPRSPTGWHAHRARREEAA